MPIWLIQLIVGVILSIASTLIQQALTPKSKTGNVARGYRGSVQTGGTVPQSFLVGTIGVPGKLEYRNTWGTSGGTPNAYLVDVISLGDLPISGVTGFFVNSGAVTKTSSGHVTQGYPVAEMANGAANRLWWEFFDGSQTTANTYLTGKFGSDADRPWLTDMIGRGIPYLTMTALVDEKVWNGFPTYMAVCQGIPLYDPRLDDTAGGTGDQRWDDASTWAFSDNNIVIVYNILRGIYDLEGNHVWGGHATAAKFVYANIAAAMDACDEAVDLEAGGAEARFRAGREIFLNERPADVIQDLLIGANARICPAADGTYYVLVGVPADADGTFTDADVIVTEATTLDPFPNLDQIVNGATGTYLEPSQAWEQKETSPYYRSDLEAEDDDRRQLEGLDLGTTFSGTQAQRILKAVVEESRRFARHVAVLPPVFGVYRPLQVLAWTSTVNGYTSKLFLITARTEFPNGNVMLGLQEIDPADHDWTPGTDEQPISFAPSTPIRPATQDVADFSVAPYAILATGSVPFKPAIQFFWNGAVDDVRALQFEVRLADDESLVLTGEFATRFSGGVGNTPGGALKSVTDYEARGRYVPISSRDTDWTDWLAVTTPDVPDVDVTDIQVSQLGTELQNAYGLLTDPSTGGSIPAQLLALNELAAQLAEAVMAVADTVKQRLDVLDVHRDGAAAAIIRNDLAILTETEARATAITEVVAQFGDALADGYFKLDAVANTMTADVSISAKVKAAVGTAVSQAAWILQAAVTEDGDEAQFAVLGKLNVIVPGGDGTFIPAIETLDDGTVKFSGTRMGRIDSLDGLSYIDFTDGIDIYSESS
jgi:hypothetical protein